MAAWKHSNRMGWDAKSYGAYRADVEERAERFEMRKEDCADLSMYLLIDFAAKNGLPVTLRDNGNRYYMSKTNAAIIGPSIVKYEKSITWSTPDEFYAVVKRKIGAEALWKQNTVVNDFGPLPGDLMLRWNTEGAHHAALVYRRFEVGEEHPDKRNMSVPSFPGGDVAMSQKSVTQYFRGDVDEDGVTANRLGPAAKAVHFDYLNSRGDDKRNAELIYFANADQIRADGFQFRMYNNMVIDNWKDWDGTGLPPFGRHPAVFA